MADQRGGKNAGQVGCRPKPRRESRKPRAAARCRRAGDGQAVFRSPTRTMGRPAVLAGIAAGSPEDMEATATRAGEAGCASVVVDSYAVGEAYLAGLRERGLFVTAIDDLAAFPFPCQLVVNGCAHAKTLPYTSSTTDTEFLLGAEYVLLRPEFWSLPKRTPRPSVESVLLCLGGADPQDLMPALLGILDDLPGNFSVTSVIGPFFENRPLVRSAAENCRRTVRLADSPLSLRDLMLEADMAVSAGGQTPYELAATGTPAVAVQVADNQAGSLAALAGLGVLRHASLAMEGDPLGELRVCVGELLRSDEARSEMSRRGRKVVDGRGAPRVAERLLQRLRGQDSTSSRG